MLQAMQAGVPLGQALDMPLARLYQILHAFAAYNGQRCRFIATGEPDEEAMSAFEAIRRRLDNPVIQEDGQHSQG